MKRGRKRPERKVILFTRKNTVFILWVFSVLLLTFFETGASGQVKIRLYSDQSPESVVFSVSEGSYELNMFNGIVLPVTKSSPVIIAKYNGRLAVSQRNSKGYVCDSLIFTGTTGDDSFSLRKNGISPANQFYAGDLICFPDLGTLLLINVSDVERYISGVVMAEGGNGKNLEYFKTQAIIARTYMYKYFDKHLKDKYNVCDNTHCQAFNGLSADSVINKAVIATKGLVILDKDSCLIISAFHSNCGGETSSSDDVWLKDMSYLKSVIDPWCLSSRSAKWRRSFTRDDWEKYLIKSGYNEGISIPADFNFKQPSRLTVYAAGSFRLPLTKIRSDLNLRSTFFSVHAEGDSIILEGRGYGHGVGLCQEGAMTMASKGFKYREIINFYYSGVTISDIKNAVILPSSPSASLN